MHKHLKETAQEIYSLLNFAFIMLPFIIVYSKNYGWEQTSYSYKVPPARNFQQTLKSMSSSASTVDVLVGRPHTSFLFCPNGAESVT